ncbi:PAS domain S-box protein [Sulfitobacter albidus]|uniref:histidine kinase n=1 Tax=Sulfitobacter albidus TaxID=2829501 RepID=A0A975JDY1_9RHOB|nr:PAS domain S-box protein [Sulfitobacter albidus]QUJ76711.1 PAS domain S-box protein [Sulfitobacter albidus]
MSKRFALLLVITSLVMSAALFHYASRAERMNASAEFRAITADSVEVVVSRVEGYGEVLRGVGAFLGVRENVSLFEYNEYVGAQKLSETRPAMLGVSYIRAINPLGRRFLESNISREYGRDITVYPETTHSELFVVSRVSPLAENGAALGLDVSADPLRREIFERSRRENTMLMSQRIVLVQDKSKSDGFLLVRPIFAKEFVPETQSTAEGDFLGWVAAPFIAREMLAGATFSQGLNYNLEVFASDRPDGSTHFFDSSAENSEAGQFTLDYPIELFGQRWTLRYTSTPSFDGTMLSYLPLLLALIGIMLSALLAMALKYVNLRGEALAKAVEERTKLLSAREQERRATLDTTMAAVLVTDDDGEIQFANAGAAALFAIDRAAFDGKSLSDFVALKPGAGQTQGYNAEGICANGQRLFLDVEMNTWTDADGSSRITALVRDVTPAIMSRQRVESVRKRYDAALAGAEIGIFEVDLETGKSIVSDTWHTIMGTADLTEEFDHQRHFMGRVHKEDLPALLEADQRCINGQATRTKAEYRVKFGDDWRWMYSDAVATERDGEGRALRLVGTQTDITEIRHARNALELSEQRFRMVLEDAPVGMALMDEQGNLVGANGALSTLVGYSEEAMINKMRLSDLLDPDEFRALANEVQNRVNDGQESTYEAELRLLTKGGEERWGLFSVTWTHDKNIDELVYIAQIVDVTDKKKVEQIKSEFVATVSHELRTPLTSIKGALGLLSATEAKNMSAGTTRLLEIARTNADRLTMIVNDILDLEKISSGEVVFDIENNNLGDIIEASVAEMQPFALEHQNTIRIDAPKGDVIVNIDASRTKQVLANLVSNACKYSDPDTEVTVQFERLDDEAIVFVQNTGPGVPDSFRESIFDAFTQADGSDTRSKGGTGLGLNITRQIVSRQSGKIGFESAPGGLTVFWFTAPLVDVDALVPRDDAPHQRVLSARPIKVLHVEDDLDFIDVIRAGFGESADFVGVRSLSEARSILDKDKWDAVVMDWTLPDGDGRDLLAEVQRKQPQARLIVLTAANGVEDPRAHATLTKSQVEIEEITATIRDAVNEHSVSKRLSFS